MSCDNNVYSGPDALWKYLHPDFGPPTALVELPENPFRSHGVRIYAKMLSQLPLGNVKALPAMNMLEKAREEGSIHQGTEEIVEYSRHAVLPFLPHSFFIMRLTMLTMTIVDQRLCLSGFLLKSKRVLYSTYIKQKKTDYIRSMNIPSTKAYLSNKTTQAKMDVLRFFGLELYKTFLFSTGLIFLSE
jgi:hypothetical protein